MNWLSQQQPLTQTFLKFYARKASKKKQLHHQALNQHRDQSLNHPSPSDQSNPSDLSLSAGDCVEMCSCVPQHFHVHPVVLTAKRKEHNEDRNTGRVIKQCWSVQRHGWLLTVFKNFPFPAIAGLETWLEFIDLNQLGWNLHKVSVYDLFLIYFLKKSFTNLWRFNAATSDWEKNLISSLNASRK